jgi:glutaminyl-peptide cyclotransferase
MKRLKALMIKAIDILKTHGPRALLAKFLTFLLFQINNLRENRRFYSHQYIEDKEQEQSPRILYPRLDYSIINTFEHDCGAFTQGLAFSEGELFESTGLYGKSTLRRVDLASGKVLQVHKLPVEYFGEGITVFRDTIIQLTWQNHRGFVYDRNSFKILRSFHYQTEGWGITHNGSYLIMSDGTTALYFLDAASFKTVGRINVHEKGRPVNHLNDLEFINGRIFANIWRSKNIAVINPKNGEITGWLDLSGVIPRKRFFKQTDVLNGVAYNPANSRLLVTGKLWPRLFEIEIQPPTA